MEKVGKKVKEVAKEQSHHLIEAGKKAGKALGERAAASSKSDIAKKVAPIIGEKVGEYVGRKAHEGIQSLKKGGKVMGITDTKPVEHKAAVEKKKSAWMEHVKAYRLAHGVSQKEAMTAAKATYKK